MKYAVLLIALLLSLAFTSQETSSNTKNLANQKSIDEQQKNAFSNKQIAKAAISALYFRPVNEISVKNMGKYYLVSYVKEGKTYKNKIQLKGHNIMWGNYDGRWRNTKYDEKLSYKIDQKSLTIITKYSDGSSTKKVFTLSDFN